MSNVYRVPGKSGVVFGGIHLLGHRSVVVPMNRRAFLLVLTATPAAAGPLRNPVRVDHFNLTDIDRRVLVWCAQGAGLQLADLEIPVGEAFESIDILQAGLFLHDGSSRLTQKGWKYLAGMEVNPE